MDVSLWQHDLPDLPRFPTLCGDLRCQVAVVGAGMTGLLTAFALRERGFDAVVLEADLPGSGATARATGSITVSNGLFFRALRDTLGTELAGRYARRQEEAVARFETLTQRLSISCGFRRLPFVLYDRKKTRALKEEWNAAHQAGIDVRWVSSSQLPFPVAGAVVFPRQACFHPMQFLYGLIPHLRIFAHSPVTDLRGGILYTPQGRVAADHIVVTAPLPFLPPPRRALRFEQSCALALEGVPALHALYQEAEHDVLSLRPHADGLLLSGRVRTVVPAPLSDPLEHLHQTARALFPQCRVTAAWGGCETGQRGTIPFVNAYVGRRADLYLAAGFSGWSMTAAMTASQFISDRIAQVIG